MRIRRICSDIDDKNIKEMTLHLLDRGHPIDLLEQAALTA